MVTTPQTNKLSGGSQYEVTPSIDVLRSEICWRSYIYCIYYYYICQRKDLGTLQTRQKLEIFRSYYLTNNSDIRNWFWIIYYFFTSRNSILECFHWYMVNKNLKKSKETSLTNRRIRQIATMRCIGLLELTNELFYQEVFNKIFRMQTHN